MPQLRKSGIDVLGDMPWGSHFCQFYQTKKDLLELLVPYFKAGLENNEFCFWIICNPLTKENALQAMRQSIPEFDRFLQEKKIEILPHVDWYLKGGKFNPKEIMDAWKVKLQQALAQGYEGMRVNGNETWLEQEDWTNFMKYERELKYSLNNQKMIVLCTYPLSKSSAASILDVAHAHDRVLTKRNGNWEILEDPEIKTLKEDLKKKNDELEQKVAKQTSILTRTIEKLKKEITERAAIEIELKSSELRYRTLIEQASDAIIITDQEGHLIEVNQSFCKMVGYREEELIGMNVTHLLDVAHLKNDPLRFDLLLQGKALFRERLMKKRNGALFPIEEHVKMLSDQRVLAIVRDITERKRTEEALRKSEDRIRLIIDTIPTMAWSMRPEGVVDYVNQRWQEYAGFSLQQNSQEPNGIIHPKDLAAVMGKWKSHKSTGKPFEHEMRLRRNDGEYRWFLVRTEPLHDAHGNLIKWYGVSIDIEDSKRAEDTLRLTYQRLSYHMDNTPLALIEWDKDLNIKRWSARAEEIFGWTAAEAVGKNMYDPNFPIIFEKDIQSVNKIAGQLMDGRVDRNVSLNHNYTRDGQLIYCNWYNSVLRDEHGTVITILSLVHDITESKKAEETLKQSYEEIRRLTEHLQMIREEERTLIAREIHDELGQQLTAIKMDVAWIDKHTSEETADIKRKLKNIIGLLDGSNLSIRRILSELRPRLLDDHGLLEALKWLGRQLNEASDIPVEFNTTENEIKVPGPIATCVFRVCQEAFTNIARYSNAKKVFYSISISEGKIMLIIADNGIGFDPRSAHHKKSFGILGMKERVHALGGNFELISSPGHGTKITAIVPVELDQSSY
jgi:PAS domain S-box-containing protein